MFWPEPTLASVCDKLERSAGAENYGRSVLISTNWLSAERRLTGR